MRLTTNRFALAAMLSAATASCGVEAITTDAAPGARVIATPEIEPAASVGPLEAIDGSRDWAGNIRDTEALTHHFEVFNTSEETVAVERIGMSCGRTQADLEPLRVPPGEVAILSVVVDAAGRSGLLEVNVERFGGADGTDSLLEVQVSAVVGREFFAVVRPAPIDLGRLALGESASREFLLQSISMGPEPPRPLLRNRWGTDGLRIDVLDGGRMRVEEDRRRLEYRMLVQLESAKVPGAFETSVAIPLGRAEATTEATLIVRGEVIAAHEVRPDRLFLGVLSSGQPTVKHLALAGVEAGRRIEASASAPWIHVSVIDDRESRDERRLRVVVDAPDQAGVIEESVSVLISGEAALRVPVRGWSR